MLKSQRGVKPAVQAVSHGNDATCMCTCTFNRIVSHEPVIKTNTKPNRLLKKCAKFLPQASPASTCSSAKPRSETYASRLRRRSPPTQTRTSSPRSSGDRFLGQLLSQLLAIKIILCLGWQARIPSILHAS